MRDEGRQEKWDEWRQRPLMERLEATVEGRVQGVSFRYYTRQRANRLGLKGWVRNEYDGSVKVIAEGERPALEGLLEYLHQGPEGARVEDVAPIWSEALGDLRPFAIAY